ncbi:MAG: cadherin-like beta sandwich domain-containing protein, partial [Mucilaginibacter sp.]
MNKIFTKAFYAVAVIAFFLTVALPASAQIPFNNTTVETGGLYSALAKDASNNIYVIRVTYGSGGTSGEVVKYTGATATVIYTGLHEGDDTGPGGDLPWGLAVTSNGDVYVSADFAAYSGAIVKLTRSGSTYTASNFQTGAYYTALAVDAANNIYATQYDGATHYAIYKYAANSANGAAGVKLYGNLKQGAGYSYPTGLAVAANGDIYVTDAFAQDPALPADGGHVYKLTAASNFATAVTVSTGHYATALALDAAGNLYTSENTGNNLSGYKLLKYTNGGGTPAVAYSPMHTNGIYYPFGIAPISAIKVYAIDGDDGTTGGSLYNLASSNVATLSVLKFVPAATFTLVSGPDYRDYTTTVPYPTSSVKVVATATDANASIKVNGVAVVSGVASASIPLNVGANVINTVVTAQDGITIKTYSITVTRTAPSTNAILSSIKTTPTTTATLVSGPDYRDYTTSVAYATNSITVTVVPQDATAKVTINGAAVASGVASSPIPLAVGDNAVTIVSTAEDGITKKTYAYKITRAKPDNAVLSALSTTPAVTFTVVAGPDYRDYTGNVSNATTSVTVKATAQDALATIKTNGQAVASGVASPSIPLSVGSNSITVVVTAQDGITTKTYSMNITRQPPGGIALNYAERASPINNTDIVVHQNLSPNGDGKSDALIIEGITSHPENKLQIISRSGNL